MRDRTADLLDANQALSQLSYSPFNLSFLRLDCVAPLHSLDHILIMLTHLLIARLANHKKSGVKTEQYKAVIFVLIETGRSDVCE